MCFFFGYWIVVGYYDGVDVIISLYLFKVIVFKDIMCCNVVYFFGFVMFLYCFGCSNLWVGFVDYIVYDEDWMVFYIVY